MRKNVAGQIIAFGMNSATDGSATTSGTPTVYYTIDGGTQGTGGGTSTHEGNGQWSYAPAQAETNGDHVVFTMAISGSISATVNVYPVAYDPSQADLGLENVSAADVNAQCDTAISDAALATAANLATVDSNVDAILVDTGTTLPASLATIDGNVDSILVDTGTTLPATLATIDGNVDSILVDTGTTIPGTLTTIDGNVDAILVDTGTTIPATLGSPAGADFAADIAAVKAETALIVADTNELQTDWADGGRLDVIIDAILLDTAEIGVAGVGLTVLATAANLATVDTVVDAIKVKTDSLTFSTANQVDCNMLAINSTATSAARLALSADVIIPGTVDTSTNTHTPTTTEFQADDITEATADHFNGRIVIFTSGVLDGQATDITDYEAVSYTHLRAHET